MSEENSFTLQIEHVSDMKFRVEFDVASMGELMVDEPPPLGEAAGPNASRLLAAAIGNCLTASLLFCLSKAKVVTENLRSQVTVNVQRNEQGRLRMGSAQVAIAFDATEEAQSRLQRCSQLFEDFCVVTASVRAGIPVHVSVAANGVDVYSDE
ncbi:MAG: hypothetical protein AMJ69_08980 [Gammaproteobacteria bacterium SG8_47]|nr:MAG: hypothetical protein AMJ69_08980 [Gammaproteobacteria bacterium SG8_47]